MNKAAIQEALLTIATRTAEQDRKVADRLASAGERSGHPAYTDLRAASQALLTGEVARARAARREFAPWAEWGSWIEGVPFAHALLFNDGLIVDVLPCRDETEFVRIYHCSPKQFYDILLATRRKQPASLLQSPGL